MYYNPVLSVSTFTRTSDFILNPENDGTLFIIFNIKEVVAMVASVATVVADIW